MGLAGYEEVSMNEKQAVAYVKAAGIVTTLVAFATLVGASFKWG